MSAIRPYSEAALDAQAEREHAGRLHFGQCFVRALIGASGGSFVQRQPTAEQCFTAELDFLASKSAGWLRGWRGTSLMRRWGLTLEQVEAWRAGGEP